MLRILVLSLLAAGITQSAIAGEIPIKDNFATLNQPGDTVIVSDHQGLDLTINVNYPGLGDNAVCAIDLTLAPKSDGTGTVSELLEKIKITRLYSEEPLSVTLINPQVARIDLHLGLYVDSAILSSYSCFPIKDVIGPQFLVVVAVSCSEY